MDSKSGNDSRSQIVSVDWTVLKKSIICESSTFIIVFNREGEQINNILVLYLILYGPSFIASRSNSLAVSYLTSLESLCKGRNVRVDKKDRYVKKMIMMMLMMIAPFSLHWFGKDEIIVRYVVFIILNKIFMKG